VSGVLFARQRIAAAASRGFGGRGSEADVHSLGSGLAGAGNDGGDRDSESAASRDGDGARGGGIAGWQGAGGGGGCRDSRERRYAILAGAFGEEQWRQDTEDEYCVAGGECAAGSGNRCGLQRERRGSAGSCR